MNRLHTSAAACVLAGLMACSQPPPQTPADLSSPQAIAISGSELFVASTNSDELRVLSLQADSTKRTFEPAPNPIYVLSIPVVSRPIALAADTDGTKTGAYLAVLSSVSSRLGVVDVAKKVEVAEVALPTAPLSLAARSLGGGAARIFIGVASGLHGSVVTVDLPPAASLDPRGLHVAPLVDLETAVPAALAISPDGTTLAIGDRAADESSSDPAKRVGGLIFFDLAAQQLHRELVGGPVRKLVYSPATADRSGNAIPAGQNLYALIDPGGCVAGLRCGGVQVVTSGHALQVLPGQIGEPMQFPGVATDFDVATSAVLALPASVGGPAQVPLLMAVASANGSVFFADGLNARIFDVNPAKASATAPQHLEPDGTPSDNPNGPAGIALTEGGIPSQQIAVTFEGALPGLIGRHAVIGTDGLLTDPGIDFTAFGVRIGDFVELSGGAQPGCPNVGAVAAVGPAAAAGLDADQLRIDASGLNGCYPASGGGLYTVRALAGQPYTVVGQISGLVGRLQAGDRFASRPRYFYRPPGFDPTQPGLTFTLGAGDPREGASWQFTVDSGVQVMSVSGRSDATLTTTFAGPVAWAQAVNRFYVGYPGGNVLFEVDPSTVQASTANNVAVFQ